MSNEETGVERFKENRITVIVSAGQVDGPRTHLLDTPSKHNSDL